jgi:hypothetical protein
MNTPEMKDTMITIMKTPEIRTLLKEIVSEQNK